MAKGNFRYEQRGKDRGKTAMKRLCLLSAVVLAMACSEKEKPAISVQLFEAQLAADARGPYYAGWDTVSFSSSAQDAPVVYLVAPEPLLTEWNITAFKAGLEQLDKTQVVTVRINAYAERKMRDFCAQPANLKRPLGLKVGERWLNFLPLLNPVTDRIALRGFQAAEIDQLQRYIDNR
jgi:hypothetical protein